MSWTEVMSYNFQPLFHNMNEGIKLQYAETAQHIMGSLNKGRALFPLKRSS